MDYRLQDLIDMPMIQELLDRLNDVYVFPSAILDHEGNLLAATGWQDLCTRFHRADAAGLRVCEESDRELLAGIDEGHPGVVRRCARGLIDTAVPIVVAGRHLADFFTGQLLLEPPDVEFFRNQAAANGFDETEYLEALSRVPIWSREQLDRHLRFVKGLTEIIRRLAERTIQENEIEAQLGAVSQRLQLATAAARAGVWDWNLVTGEMTWDERMYELYGISAEESPRGVEVWERGLHPADRERAIADCQAALAGDREFDTQFRVCRPDGSVIVVQANGMVVRSKQGTPLRMIGLNSDVTARKEAEEELRESRENLALALRSSEMGVWRLDLRTGTRRLDELVHRCLGLQPGSFAGTPDEFYRVVHPEDREKVSTALDATIASGGPYQVEYRVVWPDGSLHHIAARARLARDEAGRPYAVSGVLWDITDRKRAEDERASLESRLQHAQKMESIGRLAGCVAHDFNNMLSVILGNCDIVLRQLDPGHPLHDELTEIQLAAQRAASTTRQLLAFARRQEISPRVVDLNAVVAGTLKMLARLIGEDIVLRWNPAADLWPVRIDPSQVDQLLANLCVNARDAIAGVGHVSVETSNIVLDESHCVERAGFVPGEYVRLAVSDSGCGIDQATLPLVFDPFFTTKPLGEGTGLGLATVYGIVKQNDGFVNVCSEPGEGTRFSIYLPRAHATPDAAVRTVLTQQPEGGAETILLVEDEPSILKMTSRILRQLGYEVLAASTPGQALQLARRSPSGRMHLLLTDVVMPEMNGRELAAQVSAIHPGIKCLFTSGYTANVIADRGVLEEGVMFLEKPFSPDRLATKVREALGRPA